MQLNLFANYCQKEQLSDNYTKTEITVLAQRSPTVKCVTGTNRCIFDLVTLGMHPAAQ